MGTDTAVLAELARLRGRLPELSGSVLAGVDGMLIADDAPGMEAESIAAMSAANLGLAQSFAHTVRLGDLRETTIQSDGGLIVTYGAGENGLLTILAASSDINTALVHHEARRAASRIGALMDRVVTARAPRGGKTPNARTPLTRRTPKTAARQEASSK